VTPGEEGLGSAVASLSATGGAAIDLSDSAFLYVGAALDGARFATLSDLDRTAAGASASLFVDIVGPLALVLGSTASHAWYAEPARSGASITGRATLRYRPAGWLTTRLGYAHVLRTADDPVYGASFDRVFAEVESRLARDTWISVTTFVERGDLTFYREIQPFVSTGTATLTGNERTTTAASAWASSRGSAPDSRSTWARRGGAPTRPTGPIPVPRLRRAWSGAGTDPGYFAGTLQVLTPTIR
jgi:hypothetical protein